VQAGLLKVGEEAGGLDHVLTPRSFHASLAGSFSAIVLVVLPLTVKEFSVAEMVCMLATDHELAVHGVILEQVREVVGGHEVVDGDDLDAVLCGRCGRRGDRCDRNR
jgi:hypothetical protein